MHKQRRTQLCNCSVSADWINRGCDEIASSGLNCAGVCWRRKASNSSSSDQSGRKRQMTPARWQKVIYHIITLIKTKGHYSRRRPSVGKVFIAVCLFFMRYLENRCS